jgi:hypothetical protein
LKLINTLCKLGDIMGFFNNIRNNIIDNGLKDNGYQRNPDGTVSKIPANDSAAASQSDEAGAPVTEEASTKSRNSDYRARLQLYKKNSDMFFDKEKENVMTPLQANRGVVFPYTPNLFLSRSANYGQMDFKGSNFPIYTYINSTPPVLPLIASFTATTKEEAKYMLAAWRFFNILTQSDFGEQAVKGKRYGQPPPVLQFSYMGPFGFDRVPVLLTDFNVIIGNNVDMVPVEHPVNQDLKGGSAFGDKEVTYMPVDVEFTINMVPQYSPRRVRKDFSLDQMRLGRNIGFI